MRRAIAIIFALGLAACSSPPRPPAASEQERQASIANWHDCLRGEARKYDDGISDAGTIATGIVPLCHDRFLAVIDLWTKGENAEVQRMTRQRMLAQEVRQATPAVLQVRAERKAPID